MPGRLRRVAAPLLGVALVASLVMVEGSAATLAVSTTSIGAGTAVIPRCPTSTLAVQQTLVGSLVTAVVVSGFPSRCGGATVRVTVNNGASSASGSGIVLSGGGQVTVVLSVNLAIRVATQIDVLVTGP